MKIMKSEMFRRYAVFFLGVCVTAFGVALAIKATVGVSPITAIPYALFSAMPQFSVGVWTILFNSLLIVAQPIIDRKGTKKEEILIQCGIIGLFGAFTDISLALLSGFEPHAYWMQIASLVGGCCTTAFGAYLQVIADVAMLPADAFIRTIARVTGRQYANLRVASDIAMTFMAAGISILAIGSVAGVREGTVIAAFLTGLIIKTYIKELSMLPEKIFHRSDKMA